MNLIHLLTEFGLTRQETTLYVSLLRDGDQNGYELAKTNGISRSNTYSGLASLVDKGAAWLLEGDPLRYRAVPGAEYTAGFIARLAENRERLLPLLPENRPASGSYLTIRGRRAIIDRLHALVGMAKERIYLGLPAPLLNELARDLDTFHAGGGKLVILSDSAGCVLAGERYARATIHEAALGSAQIRLIVDSHHVMTGELLDSPDTSCLLSDHPNLVELFKSALKNEIRLAELDSVATNIPEEKA